MIIWTLLTSFAAGLLKLVLLDRAKMLKSSVGINIGGSKAKAKAKVKAKAMAKLKLWRGIAIALG